MSYVAGFRAGVEGWVHPRARSSAAEFSRHRDFLATRLLSSLSPLVLAPVYLAVRGAPQVWEAVAFLCAMLPLASVLLLSRTGNFLLAQSICIFGMIAVSVTLCFGVGGASAAAIVWLVVAPIEAAMGRAAWLVAASTFAALLTLAAVLAFAASGVATPTQAISPLLQAFFVAPAILHSGVLVGVVMRQFDARRSAAQLNVARLSALENAMGDIVLRQDATGAVVYANRESQSLLNLQVGDLMGRGLFERILVADRPAYLTAISDAAMTPGTSLCQMRLRRGANPSADNDYTDPVFVWVELRARGIAHRDIAGSRGAAGSSGDDACVVSVLRDVSRAKAHEQAIELARIEAERSSAWKDRFIANVSHELRTPLNAIIGFSEILGNAELMPADPARRLEYASIVHSSGQHLLSVVNSILDVSKIEAGRFEILAEPFDLLGLVEGCCDMMSLKASQSSVELTHAIPVGLGELVADKRACRQILLNLLSNALKFTPAGGKVCVGARLQGNSVEMYVEDSGVGIPAGDLGHLGEAFFQSGSALHRDFEGTGLGLSVVRGLVGLHGGAIAIESGVGAGTCVTVTLPREANAQAAASRIAAPIETITRIGARRAVERAANVATSAREQKIA